MTRHEEASPVPQGSVEEDRSALEQAELPVRDARVRLASGREVQAHAGAGGDVLTVRAESGQVLLRVLVTDEGPVLAFHAARIEVAGTESLRLAARRIGIEAAEVVHVAAGGELRLEGDVVGVQANEGRCALNARGEVRIDGLHIGLNDEACPRPLGWSRAGRDG